MSRSFGRTLLTTRPPIAISPSLISSSPAIIRSSVDLPHPDGPTSTQNSPSAMATSTPRMTCVCPNHLCTPVMSTDAIAPDSRPLRRSSAPRRFPRPAYDRVIRPAGLPPRDDVLRRLPPQLLLRLDRIERRMRRQDDARIGEQPGFARNRLVGKHVEGGATQYSSIERREQIGNVDDAAA